MAHIHGSVSESDLHLCALMIDQIKANARTLFGCQATYDLAIGHGDDNGFRALLMRHSSDECAQDGPTGNDFKALRNAHTLLRLGMGATRREAVQGVLRWTEGLVCGKVEGG